MTVYVIINNAKLEVFSTLGATELYLQSEYPELSEECNKYTLIQLIQQIHKYNYGTVKLIPQRVTQDL